MSDDRRLRASYVFVSDEGRVVGIALPVEDGVRGVCLALLHSPITLATWLEALRAEPDPEAAAAHLVQQHGGVRLRHVVPLPHATFLPPLAAGPVGEA